MAEKIVVLDGHTLNPGDLSWADLERLGPVTLYERTPPDQIVARALGFSCALTNKVPFSAATLAQLPHLRYIGVLATGHNIVDVAEANRRGIVVTNVPTYGTDSVAQHTIALVLELARQPALHSQAVHAGQWTTSVDWCFALAPITELSGKVLGVVGIGRIGQAVARIGAAMGMTLVAHDEYPPPADRLGGLRVEFLAVDEVFARADVLTLHCPLTAATHRLVNAERLALMKPGALLINTSRGPLVDNQALADALRRGAIGGAGLDVLDVEPPPAENPLLGAPRCIITPHIAWYAGAARQRLMDVAVANLKAFLEGRRLNTVQ